MHSGNLFEDEQGSAPAPNAASKTSSKTTSKTAPKAATASKTAPQQPTVLAHCDGGARGNPGPSGFGAVVTTEDGKKLAELSEFLGVRTNNYAEYSGLLGVLAWALEHGHSHLRVVSDSELMVKQIKGQYKVKSPDLKPLYDEARRRIGKLDSFSIAHALRHKNKDADRLANEAMDRGMGRGKLPAEHRTWQTASHLADGIAPGATRRL